MAKRNETRGFMGAKLHPTTQICDMDGIETGKKVLISAPCKEL